MNFVQCKFVSLRGDTDIELGGIAVYKNEELLGVICGCCGGWIKAYNVKIIELYDWLNIGNAIVDLNEEEEDWE